MAAARASTRIAPSQREPIRPPAPPYPFQARLLQAEGGFAGRGRFPLEDA